MLVASPPKGDSARTRRIFLKDGRKLVGYIFLPDGKGAGYKFRLPNRTHASSKRYRTIKEAKEGLCGVL